MGHISNIGAYIQGKMSFHVFIGRRMGHISNIGAYIQGKMSVHVFIGWSPRMDAISSSSEVVTVIKPPTDRRDYRFIQLRNGLGALVVHDPCICLDGPPEARSKEEKVGKKAAAAMNVGLGSFADPKDAQGLSHFLEHMILLGSTSFEKENEFDIYLAEHGGFANACTDAEHTCYFFNVEGKALFGALEKFANIFISPLMNPEAIQREILSVDSEFVGVVQDDSARRRQLQCHTSTPGHPFNGFFWGNKKSLSDAVEDIHVRDRLLKLHDDYFCGELMKLVVIGGESLDMLESRVLQLFKNVKKGSVAKPKPETNLVPIWRSGKLYRSKAVADVHLLELSWPLPSLAKDYLKKGDEYMAYLLGHEGKGSIFHLLKTRGWASSISAGVYPEGMYRSAFAYIFSINIHLTDVGVDKIFEVINYVYQYLKQMVLLSPQKWIFDELRDIGKLGFMMAEEKPEDSYAKYLADNLRVYPPEHVIYAEYAYEIWDEKMMKDILGLLNPRNMRVDLQTKYFEKALDSISKGKKSNFEIEPWFNLEYIEEDIPHEWMESWANPPRIDSSLHFPLQNMFISRNVSIRANCRESSRKICIRHDPIMTMWYEHDKAHMLPFVDLHFDIALNGSDGSLRSVLMTRLFTLLLKDELTEITYMGNEARLETVISHYFDRLVLKVDGLVDKLPVYLSKILAVLKSFLPKDDRFRVIKEDLERRIRNAHKKPIDYSNYTLKRVLLSRFRSEEDQLQELSDLSRAELEAFIPDLLSKLHIEGHCHGNLLKEEALQIADVFRRMFSVPLVSRRTFEVSVARLPPNANIDIDVRAKNELDNNFSVQLYFQIGRNTAELYILAKLVEVLVQQPFYYELRTKMQLGYEVSCGVRVNHGVLGFFFYVQSSNFDPEYLQKKIIDFINRLPKMLQGLNKNEFENHKRASVGKLLVVRDQECHCETTEVGTGDLGSWSFNLETLETLCSRKEKGDVIRWCNTYLMKPSSNCRRLAIRVWDGKSNLKGKTFYTQDDIDEFKRSAQFFTG